MPVVLIQEQNGTALVQNTRPAALIFEAADVFTDPNPPTVTLLTSPPIYRQTTVVIEVTDTKPPMALVELYLVNPDDSVSLIYDGIQFLPPFLKSNAIPIAGGFQFQINKRNGWLTPPTFKVRAINRALIEAS